MFVKLTSVSPNQRLATLINRSVLWLASSLCINSARIRSWSLPARIELPPAQVSLHDDNTLAAVWPSEHCSSLSKQNF